MRYRIAILFIFLITTRVYSQTFTQEVTASGGGYCKQINGSLQFTFGETLTETYSNSGARLYQGFQQGSYQIVGVAEIKTDTTVTAGIYPNPVADFVNITVRSSAAAKFIYKIISVEGQSIFTENITAGETKSIDLTKFAPGIYFISIQNNETGYQKTYKITKTP